MFESKYFSLRLTLFFLIISALTWYWCFHKSSEKIFTYKITPQGKLDMEVQFPENWSASDQRPIIVFFFGGGWFSGNIEQFRWFADYFTKRGLVTARVDYRVKTRHKTTPDKAVEDGQDALLWINENATKLGVNPQQIIASGGSAGGHIAACTALCNHRSAVRPSRLILLNPVMDLTNATPELEFTSGELDLIAQIGNEIAESLSPNKNITSKTPPTFVMIGGKDPLLVQAIEFKDKAEALNIPVTLKIAENQQHGFFNFEPWRSKVANFMEDYLTAHFILPSSSSTDDTDL